MESAPDYSRYSWEQLEDALAHASREQNSALFAALQSEMDDRLSQPPLPPVVATRGTVRTPTFPITTRSGCLPAFCGWLGGAVVGGIVGMAIASAFDAKLQTLDPADSGVLAQVAVFLGGMVIGSFIGLFVALRLYERRLN